MRRDYDRIERYRVPMRVRMRRYLAWRFGLLGSVLIGLALLLHETGPSVPGSGAWAHMSVVGVGCLLAALLLGKRSGGSAGTVHRWADHSRRNSGVASSLTLLTKASRWAMLRRAHIWRPSLGEIPWWRRWRVPASEYAVRMARVGGVTVWSPVEDVTLLVGGPRTGKSGEMADHIADAPGAVIATSTRLDLLQTVGPLRAARGPVYVFNPSGLGGVASSVAFDPLTGCAVPATAYARAEDLLGADAGDAEREYWTSQARRVLSGLLHAAALAAAPCTTSCSGSPTRKRPGVRSWPSCAGLR